MSVIRDLFGDRRRERTAFVLGGGGNLGAIQVGMLRALIDRDITPDIVVGCSVGAFNGAAIAGNPTPAGALDLWDRWNSLSSSDVFHQPSRLSGPWQLIRRQPSVYSPDGLRRMVREWLPYERFEQAAVPFQVVATSLHTERDRWFDEGPVMEPILASAALPGVFPPVWIDGEAYIDGGVVNNVPVSRAVELGADRIYVLHTGNFDRERAHPARPLDVLIQAFSIARSYRFRVELDRIPPEVEMITMPGIDPGPLRYNDMSRSLELMSRAYRIAGAFLDERVAVSG